MKRAVLAVVLALCASGFLRPATALAVNGSIFVERWTATGSQQVADPDTHINYTHFYFRRELFKLASSGALTLQANFGIHDYKWAPGQSDDDSYAITKRQLVSGSLIAVQFQLDTDPDKASFAKVSAPIALDSATDPYPWVAVSTGSSSSTILVDAGWDLLQNAYNSAAGNFNTLGQSLTSWLLANYAAMPSLDQANFQARAPFHGLLATQIREVEATLRAVGYPIDLSVLLPANGVDLAFTATPTYAINGSNITIDRVSLKNNRATTTGPVKLDLYAFRAPYRGGGLTNNSYLLGSVTLPDTLSANARVTSATLNIPLVATLANATYYVALLVSDGAGRTDHISFPGTLQIGPLPGSLPGEQNMPTQLINLSTRLRVETGEAVAIAGFVVSGSEAKRVIVRALGPSLIPNGVQGALNATTLELHDSTGQVVASNTGWTTSADVQSIIDSGLQPGNTSESAIVRTLQPGAYTAIVGGVGGAMGIALVEMYDLERAKSTSRPINVSTRGRVLSGDNVMIGGFVIGGNRSRRVIARALGPTLSARGVNGVLSNPQLAIYDSAGGEMAVNDDWRQSDQAAAITASGLQPPNDREPAIIMTLAPGAYTVIVRGVSGATGVGLVEVYDLE